MLGIGSLAGLIGLATAASPPVVTTGTVQGITSNSATVKGTVNPNGQSTTWAIQYGTTAAYGLQTSAKSAGSGSTEQNVSENLTGLRAGTTYHYRVIATNASGTTVGADRTFTTTGSPPSASPPTATTGNATGVGAHGATLHGTVKPNGSKTTYRFAYGLTAAYGKQTSARSLGAGSGVSSVRATLAGLRAGQTYHYRLVASNAGGVSVGQDRTFSTSTGGGGRALPAITSRVTPTVDRRRPFRFKVRGKLLRPAGVSRSRGCRGRVSIRFKARRKTVRFRKARVRRSCRYSARVRVHLRRSPRTLRVSVRFRGNSALKPRRAPVRFVRAG
jgi:hypothetical protein